MMRYAVASLLVLALLAGLFLWGQGTVAPMPSSPLQSDQASGHGARGSPVAADRASESLPLRSQVSPQPSDDVKRAEQREPVDDHSVPSDEVDALKQELQKYRDKAWSLEAEVTKLEARNRWLESKLVGQTFEGPVGQWLTMVPEKERPAEKEVRLMVQHLQGFGIKELAPAEGYWLLDRIRKDDWRTWGITRQEAVLAYFGVRRATEGLPAERIEVLRKGYPQYFR